jgi:hypothetical protein
MARYSWSVEPINVIVAFERRHAKPDSGALLMWAVFSADSLHYLADVDAHPEIVGDHDPDTADVAHARWATSTCITALDLCAAALGRTFCRYKSRRELALSSFDVKQIGKKASAEASRLLAKLPPSPRDWIADILTNAKYQKLKNARDWLTHSRIPRHLAVGGNGRQRLRLSVGAVQFGIRDVIEQARDFATESVESLLARISVL